MMIMVGDDMMIGNRVDSPWSPGMAGGFAVVDATDVEINIEGFGYKEILHYRLTVRKLSKSTYNT